MNNMNVTQDLLNKAEQRSPSCFNFGIYSDPEEHNQLDAHTQTEFDFDTVAIDKYDVAIQTKVRVVGHDAAQTEELIRTDASTDTGADIVESKASVARFMSSHESDANSNIDIQPCILNTDFMDALMSGMEAKFDERLARLT